MLTGAVSTACLDGSFFANAANLLVGRCWRIRSNRTPAAGVLEVKPHDAPAPRVQTRQYSSQHIFG